MTNGVRSTSVKDLLWLSCREKSCCHNTRVNITGRDMWRISRALELDPWDFALYAEAEPGAVDGFRLAGGDAEYQLVLGKRGAVEPEGAPCIFLWTLVDNHAQCGLGELRPLVCLTYPAIVVDDMLRVESTHCTCRRWSLNDLDTDREITMIGQLLDVTAEYVQLVRNWNQRLTGWPERSAFVEFCVYLMDAYARAEAVNV